ncbi:MAG: site-specific DNA-methyltransferase [Acidimicrobiales bacterium mtb01]|nr:site-specific DNA-methyltransferase [Actinomycetota bacterium]TEX45483.1 MAG: site-specific DNA-methyltransferase [Acidimicrobiales bacterium mtb01]
MRAPETPTATLHIGDCTDVMAAMPSGSVDLVVADPPYRLSGKETVRSGELVPLDNGDWDHSAGVVADHEFDLRWLSECQRLLRPGGTLWASGTHHNIHSVGHAMQQLGFDLLADVIWFKRNAPPHRRGRSFTHSHETFVWGVRRRDEPYVFNYAWTKQDDDRGDMLKRAGRQMRTVWSLARARNWESRYGKHPTPKPESLMERIILSTSVEGAVVLDPFAGSGTTGVAAVRTGRRFIGIDSNADYILGLAKPRLLDEPGASVQVFDWR